MYICPTCSKEFEKEENLVKIAQILEVEVGDLFQNNNQVSREEILSKVSDIINKMDININNMIDDINNVNFEINPKILKGNSTTCQYCKYNDICFHTYSNYIDLREGGEEDEVDE
jgi:DNA-directed RNA polymerase subunit RPC12/RpoP